MWLHCQHLSHVWPTGTQTHKHTLALYKCVCVCEFRGRESVCNRCDCASMYCWYNYVVWEEHLCNYFVTPSPFHLHDLLELLELLKDRCLKITIIVITNWKHVLLCINPPKGRPGMSDVSPLSGISGLSFDSTLLSPLVFFCQVLLPFLSYRFLPAGPFF